MDHNKLSPEIFNAQADNFAKLAALFPSAVKDGELDINALKEELGQFEEVGAEKYELTWAGKQNAKKLAQTDVVGRTLKYVSEDSKDADTTQNLYIEGDNLEVLKLLRQNYYGAVKMIYIDPPYNTGNDFVYRDDFAMSKAESDEAEGETVDGERMVVNQKSGNRYHANWLNMMYPRLRIAKDLLRDDGVIFISIDDNEVVRLRNLCDEIFTEDNFVCQFTVASNSAKNNSKYVSITHEYILCYAKSKLELGENWSVPKSYVDEFNQRISALQKSGLSETEIRKELLSLVKFPRFYEFDHYTYIDKHGAFRASDLTAPESKNFYDVIHPVTKKPCKTGNRGWAYSQEGMQDLIDKDLILWGKDETVMPQLKNHLNTNQNSLPKSVLFFDSQVSTKWLKAEKIPFDFPKPIQLLHQILNMCTEPHENSIILDFFSGSATTAHAVMQLNAEDGGKRRFICVQLPEVTEKAFKAGYANICEIGKERIRRAGEKIGKGDVGFRVFRTADTNIRWTHEALKSGQMTIDEAAMSKKEMLDFMPGYTDIDVVYEILLRQRDIPLSTKIEKLDIGKRTYMFADSYVVCLDESVTVELVEALAAVEPTPIRYVFRDSAFDDNISLKDETIRRLEAYIARNSGEKKKAYTVEFI